MRAYRSIWCTTVLLLAVVSGIVGLAAVGPMATVGTSLAFAALGALFGFSWIEEPARRPRAMAECALWFGVAGMLIIGLPPIVGAWSLPVLILIGVSCPMLAQLVLSTYRTAHPVAASDQPARLSDRDLARRWRWSTAEIGGATDPALVARLVEERSGLLDELERRDPERFADWLVRSGWREPQDR